MHTYRYNGIQAYMHAYIDMYAQGLHTYTYAYTGTCKQVCGDMCVVGMAVYIFD